MPRQESSRNAAAPWLVSMLIGGVLILLIELGKHHYAAHNTSGRIGGAILIWVMITLVIRFVMFLAERVRDRSA
jgi:hypothetical protein